MTSLAALVALAVAPAALASFPGRNGRIAIQVVRGNSFTTMSTIRPDGSHLRRMPGVEGPGYWSPDGSRFLFDGVCHAKLCGYPGEPGPNELRSVEPDGRGLRVIHFPSFPKSYPAGPQFAAWSPTGRRLVYMRSFPEEEGATALFISSARGTHERLLALPSVPHVVLRPRWSPDGSEIAFIDGTSLDTVRPDGTGLRTIVQCRPPQAPPPDCAVGSFDWSPDGSQLAVAEKFFPLPEAVFVVDRSGADPRKLRDGDAPFWSPDGKRIGSIVLPDKTLQISNADGSALRTLRTGVFSADWQPLPR